MTSLGVTATRKKTHASIVSNNAVSARECRVTRELEQEGVEGIFGFYSNRMCQYECALKKVGGKMMLK